jgi:hypothetical protein
MVAARPWAVVSRVIILVGRYINESQSSTHHVLRIT